MALSTPLVLPLLLLMLVLPPVLRGYLSAADGHLSKDDDAVVGDGGGGGSGSELHPVILLPGMGCSDLEARLTAAYRPSLPRCGAMKGKGWFQLWKNASDLAAHDYVPCFLEQMRLVYDPAVNDYRNLPDVETRVPNFGSTRAFRFKNPLMSDWCLGKLRATLENKGYRDGDTMFGAPYDFRYAPPSPGQKSEVYSRYFKKLMELVETASNKKHKKKAVILGHSFGGMVALEFVRSTPAAWRDEHIGHLILIAPTLSGGFMEPVSNVASGTNILFVPTATPLAMRDMWRSFESAIVNFPSPAVFGDDSTVVVTRARNYSAHDMEGFLAAVGFGDGVEPFRRRAVPRMMNADDDDDDDFVPPMVPTTCINGVGNPTPMQIVFRDDDDFDAPPEAVAYGDGDGKINLISVLAFEKQMRRQPGQRKLFRTIKISKAQHSTIVTEDFALDRVIQQITDRSQ